MNNLLDSLWLLSTRLLRVLWLTAVALLVLCFLALMAILGLVVWLVYRLRGRPAQANPFMRFQQTAHAWRTGGWQGTRSHTDASTTEANVVDVQARELDPANKRLH
ncbi:hypothetical protein KIK84_12215 [Curvibacter sp. CHRR-16]|uniref:hypothetical protein n=1 Tax=Curvibacter sp. CHRR-16 TaxID=2835872 RepID=UPI001BDB1292|nr:hypothetical protein [Curvibacter sp. CHRR-16]MBT0571095.1 hypothetical protein [Curvibacter sp. CHRR-16]